MYINVLYTVGRCASVLQEQELTESSLWMSTLYFLSTLLSEEGKLGQTDKVPEYTISERIDR